MIMAWDAVTFDVLCRPSKNFDFPASAVIGTEIKGSQGPFEVPLEYPPLVFDSRYCLSGRNRSKVLGVTLRKDVPCAIIEFSTSENVIRMNLRPPPVEMTSRVFEHVWGKTYLSLEDGSIVEGELVAPLTQVQDLRIGSQGEPQHLEYFVLQELHLEMLTAEEFDQEVKGERNGQP